MYVKYVERLWEEYETVMVESKGGGAFDDRFLTTQYIK